MSAGVFGRLDHSAEFAERARGTQVGLFFGPEGVRAALGWRRGWNAIEFYRELFLGLGGYALADTPGGRDALRIAIDPSSADVVDQLTPTEVSASFFASRETGTGQPIDVHTVVIRTRDAAGLVGRHVGDGVVAFFLAETSGSEPAAARASAAHRLLELTRDRGQSGGALNCVTSPVGLGR